ncbi:MAG: PAS domain S-box protein, partial [Gammaproteobacteria bacterium]
MNQHPRFKIFLLFFLPFVFVLSFSFIAYLILEHQHEESRMASNEKIQIELARVSLVRDFENVLPDIATMANEIHLRQFIEQGDSASRQQVINEFVSFLTQKRSYGMARILNAKGREVIRISYDHGKTDITPEQNLEDKSNRQYFRDSINLGINELYISPIDLNVEDKKVQLPFHPVIHFAMPLFNQSGNKWGVIVFNYLAEPMLRHFDEMLAGTAGHVALLNSDGFWIRSHKREREWGFMFGRTETFGDRHPDIWQIIRETHFGQTLNDDGLFTYATVYPIQLIGGYSKDEVEDTHVGHHHIDPTSYAWHVVSDIPSSALYQHVYDHIYGILGFVWIFLILSGAYGSHIACRSFAERASLRQMKELHSKIYSTTTDGILITDPNSNIVAVNNAFTDITGYSENEVLGKKQNILS